MSKPERRYSNGEIVVIWRPGLCEHSGECLRSLPSVFRLEERPWVRITEADSESIKSTVEKCPSGALTWEKAEEKPT